MRNYINGARPTGIDMFGKVYNHQMTRIYFRGKNILTAELENKLEREGISTEAAAERQLKAEGWKMINFMSLPEALHLKAATIVMMDDFEQLEIATNETD